MSNITNKRIALVYDRVNKWGGAERILLALHELFPDAPLFTSVYNFPTAQWAKVFTIKTSFLQRILFTRNKHELFAPLMPIVFENFSFDEFDVVISVTSEAAKGIITKPQTKHICYCLTPTRYLWSGYRDYFHNRLFTVLAKPVTEYLQKWDKIAAQRPDVMISISEEVKKRIEKYYGRDSVVVYPPVSVLDRNSTDRLVLKKGYFLIVSRLVPYKRIDLAIKACNDLQLPLKIIGAGSELSQLQKIAGPTIEFFSNLSDEDLAVYYENCSALLFPGIEDFGLSMVEAQSMGKPVIAYAAGGALEIVSEGKTGAFFSPQTVQALKKVLISFSSEKYSRQDCQGQAKKFNKERFRREFLALIEKAYHN